MVEIIWSETAKYDFKNICNYIKCNSEYYSKIFKLNILKRIDNLNNFPKIGRVVPEYKCEFIREIIYGNYRIIYEFKTKIEILTIAHVRMKINSE